MINKIIVKWIDETTGKSVLTEKNEIIPTGEEFFSVIPYTHHVGYKMSFVQTIGERLYIIYIKR